MLSFPSCHRLIQQHLAAEPSPGKSRKGSSRNKSRLCPCSVAMAAALFPGDYLENTAFVLLVFHWGWENWCSFTEKCFPSFLETGLLSKAYPAKKGFPGQVPGGLLCTQHFSHFLTTESFFHIAPT